MAFSVTLNIFSGHPNPTWLLSEEQSREFLGKVNSIQSRVSVKARGVGSGFGYQGFLVVSSGSAFPDLKYYINRGIVDPDRREMSLFDRERSLESWLLSAGGNAVDQEIIREVQDSLSTEVALDSHFTSIGGVAGGVAGGASRVADSPAFQPELWSDDCTQGKNNCYNYALDKITNTFAQPGAAHGVDIGKKGHTCSQIEAAAHEDGLDIFMVSDGRQDNKLPDLSQGWYIALAIKSDGTDYHWFRQDSDGGWSHKLGNLKPSREDIGGKVIENPRDCDRGHYDQFCGYMISRRGIVIR